MCHCSLSVHYNTGASPKCSLSGELDKSLNHIVNAFNLMGTKFSVLACPKGLECIYFSDGSKSHRDHNVTR